MRCQFVLVVYMCSLFKDRLFNVRYVSEVEFCAHLRLQVFGQVSDLVVYVLEERHRRPSTLFFDGCVRCAL